MSSTSDIARQVVESGDTRTNDDTNTSNAPDYPEVAGQELDQLMADDPTNATRKIAAALSVVHDRRPYTSTRQGMVRRAFEAGDPVKGTAATRLAAREALDGMSFGEAMRAGLSEDDKKAIAKDRATLHANDFSHSVHASTMGRTLPENASVDDIVNAIIARRNAK